MSDMTINNKLDENSQIQLRKEKLEEITKLHNGISHPNDFKRNAISNELHAIYGKKSKSELENIQNKKHYKVAGRIVLRRVMGKASFITLQDMLGKIQIYLKKSDLPEGVYNEFKALWDLGDIVGIEGEIFKTNTGELSLHAINAQLLTKSIRPLPDKFHGLSDLEMRYRQRYVDLITNEKSRDVFKIRSKVISYIRTFLMNENYIEAETPMMHVIPGGATAKPFVTHHNALNMPLYLRVAPELYLKRLVVGGFERVFEINRNFRNEGVSSRHNPEFTMLEFYQAYADYTDLMRITENMLSGLAEEVLGTTEVHYQGSDINFKAPYTRISMVDAILKYNENILEDDLLTLESVRKIAAALNIAFKDTDGIGKITTQIFEDTVEHKLIQPTFITQYPHEVSPLARINNNNSNVTDRFEFFIGGREIANGFSELNDAQDQAKRFEAQVRAKDAGDDEAMFYDDDYIRALEYGMPPTAGEGIGIDRLVMYLTDSASIRDVILFPHMRKT